MKECSKCKEVKEFDCFHKRKDVKGGFRKTCKNCIKKSDKVKRLKNKENPKWVETEKARVTARRLRNMKNPEWVRSVKEKHLKNKEANNARCRKRYHSLKDKRSERPSPEKEQENTKIYNAKYPEKYAAKSKAKRRTLITKGNHRHHWSYNEGHYTDIIELSVKDHHTAHRFMTYDQEHMMYRTLEGDLLDTKEAHIEYVKEKVKFC